MKRIVILSLFFILSSCGTNELTVEIALDTGSFVGSNLSRAVIQIQNVCLADASSVLLQSEEFFIESLPQSFSFKVNDSIEIGGCKSGIDVKIYNNSLNNLQEGDYTNTRMYNIESSKETISIEVEKI